MQHFDNGGFRTSPHSGQSQPVITQTALRLTQTSAGTNTTITVADGGRYRFTSYLTGGFRFGVATTVLASNIRWVCPIYQTIEIQIPRGVTTLHYTTDVNSGLGFLIKLLVQDEDVYQA